MFFPIQRTILFLGTSLSFTTWLSIPSALGAIISTTLRVTLDLIPTCIISATSMDFGVQTDAKFATGITSTATITVTCNSGIYYLIGLDNGLNPSFSGLRYLKSSNTDTLQYELYQDPGYTTVWGYGAGKVSTIMNLGTGAPQTQTVYGKIISTSVLWNAPGPYTYTDIVTVTLDY